MSPHESAASRTATAPAVLSVPLQEAVHSASADVLKAAAVDSSLTEDLALALLKRSDLPSEVLEQLSKNSVVMKGRKVKLAMVGHPRTPRYVSMSLVRQLFTFDLMQVALTPAVPGDIKVAAEDALIHRLETMSSGERLSLARRASGRVAGALLQDLEQRVIHTALENARLTESSIIRALMSQKAQAVFVQAVCHHPKWSPRREIRIALLRNESTPLGSAMVFARALPAALVREILQNSRLPSIVKTCLMEKLEQASRENS